MDIPDLVQQALGGEEIQAGVSLGDEDAVCFTPTRALVYSGEGLISDEGVEEYPLDVERLGLKRGRRKTKFVFQYLDGSRSFTVPSNRDDDVLERLLEGVLRIESVIDERESVGGVYLFSELTLVVAEKRVVKHVGEALWDEDYEVYDFAEVTGLEFERTSVATSIVLDIQGHPQRVKVPNDNAALLRRTLQEALFEFHDVESLEELNRLLGEDDEIDDVAETDESDDLTFGSDIDPLVTDREDDLAKGVEDPFAAESSPGADPADESDGTTPDASATGDDASATDDPTGAATGERSAAASEDGDTEADDDPLSGTMTGAGPKEKKDDSGDEAAGDDEGSSDEGGSEVAVTAEFVDDSDPGVEDRGTDSESDSASSASDEGDSAAGTAGAADAGGEAALPSDVATREDVQAVADRLDELTDAVDRQNELLKRQHRAMKQLVEQLDSE